MQNQTPQFLGLTWSARPRVTWSRDCTECGHTDKGPQRRCALEVVRWLRVGAQSFGADLGLRDEGDCA